MIKILLFSLIFLISCSFHHPQLQITGFEKLVQDFQNDGKTVGIPIVINDLIIQFQPLESNIMGKCILDGQNTPIIQINANEWQFLIPGEQKTILYHELGHCILFRPHNELLRSDGTPVSIMFPIAFDMTIDYNYYINELFWGNK